MSVHLAIQGLLLKIRWWGIKILLDETKEGMGGTVFQENVNTFKEIFSKRDYENRLFGMEAGAVQ